MRFIFEEMFGADLYKIDEKFLTNCTDLTADCLDLDTSQYPFPNTLWLLKPAREIAFKSSAMVIVGIIGIFLNSIILIILMRNRWLWTPSNILVGNMAIVDMLTLLICPWFMLVRDFYQNYVLRNFGCRFEGFLQATLLLASVGSIMLVSYDRLAAACLTAEARVTKHCAPKLILITWIAAMGLSLPWIIKRHYQERQWLDFLEMFCVEDVSFLEVYWHFILMLLVWLPLGVMIVTYGGIIWRLECSARELTSRGGGKVVVKARGKAMRVTAMVLVASTLCRLPYTVLIYWRNNMAKEINAVEGGYEILWFTASYLMYLNCALNPLIYGFTNVRFRRAMDRTPGLACFRFGTWCCVCCLVTRKTKDLENARNEIFVIETSPKPKKKLSNAIKNILNINKQTLELSVHIDEVTTKPTKVTPIRIEQCNDV
ncbi:unnamed protein product [Pieris macdunnoughi]|uniref:G-protein coupled receptors family 1 profile domain-containing protein n=2 Tax=Pieris macdunnoughi TaxID=345717 RepID=A0A821TZF7_9NEOP|nr:unnamed protein product [Pieris macdunnoughi]